MSYPAIYLFSNISLFQVKHVGFNEMFLCVYTHMWNYLRLFMENENFGVALLRGINVNYTRGH